MIWIPYDWLNKYYSFCIAAIVGIVSRHRLKIEACHRNQPNKSKLACISHYFTLTVSCKGGVVCVGVHVSRCLKEELAWATDKQLRVISNIMLFKTVIPLRN